MFFTSVAMLHFFFWTIICQYCLALATLSADEDIFIPPDEPFASSLVKTQNLLSTVVDSVSAISGEWIQSETDFVILGPEPLILHRFYSNNCAYNDRLGYNWEFSRPRKLILNMEGKKKNHAKVVVRLQQSSGISTIHKSTESDKTLKTVIPLYLGETQGLTNCRGEISGKTNLHNTVVLLDNQKKYCKAVSGNGDFTYYKLFGRMDLSTWKQGKIGVGTRHDHLLEYYHPIYERKPNGNKFLYGKGIISATNSSKKVVYSTLKFESPNLKNLVVTASDGKQGTYHFKVYNHPSKGINTHFSEQRYCLAKASFSHKPSEIYEYTQPPPDDYYLKPKISLLKARRLPEGRFQQVGYYHKGTNHLNMDCSSPKKTFTIEIDHKDDFRVDRVKVVKAPVGHDEKPVITHGFIYGTNRTHGVKKKDRKVSGWTTVYDAYLHKTTYHYNSEHRPTKIQRFDKSENLYTVECFTWDDQVVVDSDRHMIHNAAILPDPEISSSMACQDVSSLFTDITSLVPAELEIKLFASKNSIKPSSANSKIKYGRPGNLLGKYIKDANKKILYARFFDYDKKGNIGKDRLYGDLTGKSAQCIELDFQKMPVMNGCEYYEKSFKYSDDDLNLLKEEKEDNGKGIIYDYYLETDLIAAKYVTENGNILSRQFYHYDSNATLIKTVKDDGTGKEENDLTDVHERLFTYIHPRKELPFGFPECVEHKYLDENGKEKLIKKICSHYSREGYLEKEDHYNSDNQFCYSLHWQYDAHGNITREVNALGHEVVKSYDANDNLQFERGPRPGDKKEYIYDFANRLISTRIKADGKSWATYSKYDFTGNCIEELDRYGNETLYRYDEFNRLTKTTYPSMEGEISRPATMTDYDCLNHPVKKIDERGHETIKTFNIRGKVTSILYPDGQKEHFEYHPDGLLAKKIASNGTATCYQYDCLGRLLREQGHSPEGELLYETSNTYNFFHKTSSTDAEGLTTFFEYDRSGRLIKTSCLDKIECLEYDPLGRLSKKKQAYDQNKMKVTCTEYDFLDQILEERIEDEKGQVLKKIAYEYDELGNRTHIIEETAAGISKQITYYNLEGKPVKIVDPENNTTHITYDQVKNCLDQWVLQTSATDPLGRQMVITYDARERPVNIKRKDINAVLLTNQDLVYDPQGNLIRLVDHIIVQGDEIRKIETKLTYQETGKLICLIQAHRLPEQQITRTKYNLNGQKAEVIKNDGTILFHTYDPLGRLKAFYSSDRSIDYRYQYNNRHQVLSVEDNIQKTSSQFRYDERGNLATEILSTGIQIHYIYDQLDRVARLMLPESTQIDYKYDALNVRQITRQKNGETLYAHCYDVDDLSGLNLKETTINALENIYTFDLLKRPLNKEGRLFKLSQAGYDECGRLINYQLQDPQGSLHIHYAYDDNDHLIAEEGNRKHCYICDSVHNRLTKNGISHTSNGLNQLTNNGEHDFSYDPNGNLKKKLKGNQAVHYAYDAMDRLLSVTEGQKTTRYIYDAFNRRVAKIKDNQTTHYLYVSQDEIGAIDEKGKICELRVLGRGHGAEIGASIAIELHDKIYAVSHDFGGNVAVLSDQSGEATETYRYTAFGETTIYNSKGEEIQNSLVGNPWQFSGKRVDEESGFIYFGRRYYDPGNGRWITSDPAGLSEGPNLYAYLSHSPLQAFDFYGLQEEPIRDADHDKSTHHSNGQKTENSDAPVGFVEKKNPGEKDRTFFEGTKQIAELGIIYVNGMMNSLKDASASAKAMSEMASDHYVTFVHNVSHGFVLDVVRCFFELYFYWEFEAHRTLKTDMDAFFSSVGPNAFLFLPCFSEGAIIVRNVLRKYSEELRQRIIIAAYDPAGFIPEEYAYKVTHYRSARDFVPYFDFIGLVRCRATTVVLDPHPDAPLFDHAFNSPTLNKVQKYETQNFIQTYGDDKCRALSAF